MTSGWALCFLYLLVAGAIYAVAQENRRQRRKPVAGAALSLLAAALWPLWALWLLGLEAARTLRPAARQRDRDA